MKSIFISVRTNSRRLPQKALIDLCGKPTIQYLIENLKKTQYADKIILCTSRLRSDDVLCEIAQNNGIKCFRGSLEDKLARWLGACEKFNIDFFVNVDGDDLFFDFGLADHLFKQYESSKCDFIDGHGLYNDVYGITYTALKRACENKITNEVEYIRPHFTEKGAFSTQQVENIPPQYLKKDIRMTLDYADDFKFFETVIIGLGDRDLTFANILKFLENNPRVKKINYYLEEQWKENQKNMIDHGILNRRSR